MTLTTKKEVFFPSANILVNDFYLNSVFKCDGTNMGVFYSNQSFSRMQETPIEFTIKIELTKNKPQVSCGKPTKKVAEQNFKSKEFQIGSIYWINRASVCC